MAEQPVQDVPQKQHRSVNGEAEYEAAISEVISTAERTLHIFDADLTRGGYTSPGRAEALREFLLRGRGNSIVLVLHETDFLTARCPRLMLLLQTHSHNIQIRKTDEHARIATDPFIVADEAHYVHRFHQDDARALMGLYDHAGARELEERFSQLAEASHPAVFATTLGL